MYQNQKDYDAAEVVFYEIFRRHFSNDPRDSGADWEYVIGSANSIPEAEDFCYAMNMRSESLKEKYKGYKQIWEDTIRDDGRVVKRCTGRWTDEFGFQHALDEFRKIDPTYYVGGNPKYMYRAIRRMPTVGNITNAS